MTNHTSLPWWADDGFVFAHGKRVCDTCVNDEDEIPMTEEEAEANAAFIVTACNSHHELVSALQSALSAILMAEELDGLDPEAFSETKATIRAALAKLPK